VVVCTNDGRILLYNGRAQRLLESAADRPGQTDWIGLGRSIHGVLDAGRTLHALDQLRRRLDKGQTDVLVPFVATTSGGRLLSAHMVPILAADAALRGYLLTLDDVTGQLGSEDQRERLLRTLLEDQRGAVAGIRSAIETLVAFPDIDAAQRRQFHAVIDGDAARLSARLEQFEKDYGAARSASLPTEALLVSDLLAEVNGHLQEARGLPVEVEVPVEPVWIRADRYLICQCVLFLVDRLIAACRASDFAVSLQSRGGLVALYLEWTGSPLHGEAMKLWGNVALSGDGGGGGHGTLFEAFERLGGAVWPLRASPAGRPCIRLVLPAAEAEAETAGGGSPSASSHAFDFRLFDHDAGAASADLPLSRVACTVVDTETTGLEPGKGDEIIAVGAVRIVNGRLLRGETFDTLVKPRRTGTGLGEAIHGITQQMLRGQPAIEEVLPRLHRFVADTVVVGHDVAFDMRFFEEAGTPLGCAFTNPTLDTLLLDSVVNPRQKDKRLAAIAERLGVTVIGRHTALGDALTTAEVFLALVPLLEANGIRTLAQARAAAAAAPGARISY
jgi:DNA polymerase-3 subunit epsilon